MMKPYSKSRKVRPAKNEEGLRQYAASTKDFLALHVLSFVTTTDLTTDESSRRRMSHYNNLQHWPYLAERAFGPNAKSADVATRREWQEIHLLNIHERNA